MIQPIASPWSGIRNFLYHQLATSKPRLGEIISNICWGVDVSGVVRNKTLCQAPPLWRHNAMPWWRHVQNITRFRNIKLDTLRDVKTTSKYWLNFVFLTLRVKTKRQVLLRDTVHQTSIGDSPLDMWWTVLRNNKILSLHWNILWYVTKCTQSFALFYFGDCIVRFQLIQIIFLHIFFMVASRAQSRATMPLSQCQWLKVTHNTLTHWSRVTHKCVGKLHVFIIGSDNGLSPDRRQAIIWTNAGLLSIGPLRTYFSENLIKMQQFSLKKMHVKMSSAKWRLSCLGHNVTSVISPNVITLFLLQTLVTM